MLLTNMLYFIELQEGVKLYNGVIESIQRFKEELKGKKAEMKKKF